FGGLSRSVRRRHAVSGPTGVLRRGLRILLAVSVVGTLASATEMAVLFHAHASTTRLYFGTDTEAQSLLVGIGLACSLALRNLNLHLHLDDRDRRERLAQPARSSLARRAALILGIVGLATLLVLAHVTDGASPFLYDGGFLVASLAAAGLIWSLTMVPGSGLTRLLDGAPLAWIGTISYGLYLWHFPLFIYLSPARTGLSGIALLGLRTGTSIAVAAASYYVVERPVMRGTFWRSLRAMVPSAAIVGAVISVAMVSASVSSAAAGPVRHFTATRPITPSVITGRSPALTSPVGTPPNPQAPPEVVVLGDSTALTLGYALAATAPSGTTVANGGLFGCGLAIATEASGDAPHPGLPMFPACNSATPVAKQWPALDQVRLAGTHPGDQVVFLAGHWETQDLLQHGHWTNILAPSFQRYELAQMRLLARIATAQGAHLDLLTMPCMNANFPYGAPPGPTDSAARRKIYNGLLSRVAAEFPTKVSVIDFGRILCPTGSFTELVGGVQVRTPDGIHTPSYAPGNVFVGNSTAAVAHAFYRWISPRLWPLIIDPPSSGPASGPNRAAVRAASAQRI
ncbi:MAG: hypothetical protein ACYCV7_01615, partial [Acidimicrobiales bacterium]